MDVRHRRVDDAHPFRRPRRAGWPRLRASVLLAVYVGGVAGGLARYAVTSAWPTPTRGFPWATFVVNTAGAFALAVLLVLLIEGSAPRRYARPLLGTGFLGAFTTFSSVVAATAQLAAHGHGRTATGYLAGSVLATLCAAFLGLLLGRSFIATRHGSSQTEPRRRR